MAIANATNATAAETTAAALAETEPAAEPEAEAEAEAVPAVPAVPEAVGAPWLNPRSSWRSLVQTFVPDLA